MKAKTKYKILKLVLVLSLPLTYPAYLYNYLTDSVI